MQPSTPDRFEESPAPEQRVRLIETNRWVEALTPEQLTAYKAELKAARKDNLFAQMKAQDRVDRKFERMAEQNQKSSSEMEPGPKA